MNNVANYFSLWTDTPVLGHGIERVRQPLYFLGVLGGACALVIFNALQGKSQLVWTPFVIALIVSIITFPYVYEHAGLGRARLSLAKWCLAFQYGFFWPALMDKVQAVA